MNRTEKQSLIDELHKDFQGSPHAILVDYRGLSVPAATEFRRRVRKASARYRVVIRSAHDHLASTSKVVTVKVRKR